jgi:hypothetical protein
MKNDASIDEKPFEISFQRIKVTLAFFVGRWLENFMLYQLYI